MAVVLRLTRKGQKKLPFYRIVAAEKTRPRDGKFIEVIGTYNTLKDPAEINIKEDRVKHWIESGALPTKVVRDIINRAIPDYLGPIEEARKKKIQDKRKARKARLKKAA